MTLPQLLVVMNEIKKEFPKDARFIFEVKACDVRLQRTTEKSNAWLVFVMQEGKILARGEGDSGESAARDLIYKWQGRT
jgi:hypothetical protein